MSLDNATADFLNGTSTPAEIPVEVLDPTTDQEVALVKMQRDYDGRIEEVHPDGVVEYERSGAWKRI